MRSARFALGVVALTLLACGGGGTEPPDNNNNTNNPPGTNQPPGGTNNDPNQVSVSDNLFEPASLTVAVGATVTWAFNGGYSEHNVTFNNTSLGGSGNKSSGTYTKTFNSAGTFGYMCTIHGSAMSGTVIVQ